MKTNRLSITSSLATYMLVSVLILSPLASHAQQTQTTSSSNSNSNAVVPIGGSSAVDVRSSSGSNIDGRSPQQPPVTPTTNSSGGNAVFTLQNPLKGGGINSISDLILAFMKIVSYLAVIFAVLALMYVGFLYVMARGNSEKMKELSNWLLMIVIGLAIILGARILVSAIINTLQATGAINPAVIQNAQNAINTQ